MTVYKLGDRVPEIGDDSYICPSATVIGDVTIGEDCFIGPGARLRGDYGRIIIGSGTAVEDNVVVHARPGELCAIGKNVTLGHAAIIHNATIGDWSIIGMGAVVSDYAKLEEWAVVAEGAVVKNKQVVGSRKIAVGVPAKVIGEVGDAYMKQWIKFKAIYQDLARSKYPEGLEEVE